MNILFLFEDPIVPMSGGVERVTDTLSREFVRRGHNVAFLCFKKQKVALTYKSFSAPQYFLNLKQSPKDIRHSISLFYISHRTEIIIMQNPSDEHFVISSFFPSEVVRIGVCHVQPYHYDSYKRKDYLETIPVNWKHNIARLLGIFSPYLFNCYASHIMDLCYSKAIQEVDAYCMISNKFVHRIIKHLPNIDQSKIIAIPNPNTFPSLSKLNKKEKLLVWAGRMVNNGKNALGFIKMWAIFVKKNPQWKAVMIGDGPDFEYNKRYVVKHSILNIDFLGKINNIRDYYERASFVVVTSKSESWSMVLTEGMTLGCIPCAYNTYETLGDIVENNVSGIIVEKVNPNLMAAKLTEIIKDEAKMKRMSACALEKSKNFSIESIADIWENYFRKMCTLKQS